MGEEANGIRRELSAGEDGRTPVTGTAVATGDGADGLLRRLDGVRAAGSSRWLDEPGVSPELTVDGDPKTYWAADPDETPRLTADWPTTAASKVCGSRSTPTWQAGVPPTIDVTLGGRTVRRTLSREGVVSSRGAARARSSR